MKLSDYKGEEAIEVLADIIEPLAIILGDADIIKLVKEQQDAKKKLAPIAYMKPILKNHPSEIIAVLAGIEKKPVEEYKEEVNVLTLPLKILEFLNDPTIQSLFTSQGQTAENLTPHSGSAMENIEADEK